jgi:hypothetical protein
MDNIDAYSFQGCCILMYLKLSSEKVKDVGRHRMLVCIWYVYVCVFTLISKDGSQFKMVQIMFYSLQEGNA